MPCEHLVDARAHQRPTLNQRLTGDDGVPGGGGTATQPSLDRIIEHTGEDRTIKFPHGEISDRADRQLAELALTAQTPRSSASGDLLDDGKRRAAPTSCRHYRSNLVVVVIVVDDVVFPSRRDVRRVTRVRDAVRATPLDIVVVVAPRASFLFLLLRSAYKTVQNLLFPLAGSFESTINSCTKQYQLEKTL